MLVLSRRVNERIVIGDDVFISVIDIKHEQVKVGVEAPPTVRVHRYEVYETIQRQNRAAAAGLLGPLPELRTTDPATADPAATAD